MRLIGENDMCTYFDTLLFVLAFIGAFFTTHVWLETGLISFEELELMEKDLAGEKEWGQWGYSTDEAFSIGFCRIPRKGLNVAYFGRGYGYRGFISYIFEFHYEDGSNLSAKLRKVSEASDDDVFVQLIHRYDDSVKICRHKIMEGRTPLFGPFKKFNAEVPYLRKENLEKLNTLCIGNPFWWLRAKSRDKWDGNKEVEITLCGTALTWLLYLVWLCLSGYFFFGAQSESVVAMLLVLLVAGLFYYLFFIKSAGKITDKAIYIFYKDIFFENVE